MDLLQHHLHSSLGTKQQPIPLVSNLTDPIAFHLIEVFCDCSLMPCDPFGAEIVRSIPIRTAYPRRGDDGVLSAAIRIFGYLAVTFHETPRL